MKKYIIVVIFFSVMFSGCDGILFPKSKYRNLPNLGSGYRFDTGDGNSLAIVNSDNDLIINMEILEFTFDSTFVVASQRPWDVPDIPNIKNMTLNERDEAFENSKFLQYWIINKKQKSEYSFDSINKLAKYSNVYGPFKKEEYIQKRKELGVPKSLKIK